MGTSPEEVAQWRAERRKNWPTKGNLSCICSMQFDRILRPTHHTPYRGLANLALIHDTRRLTVNVAKKEAERSLKEELGDVPPNATGKRKRNDKTKASSHASANTRKVSH